MTFFLFFFLDPNHPRTTSKTTATATPVLQKQQTPLIRSLPVLVIFHIILPLARGAEEGEEQVRQWLKAKEQDIQIGVEGTVGMVIRVKHCDFYIQPFSANHRLYIEIIGRTIIGDRLRSVRVRGRKTSSQLPCWEASTRPESLPASAGTCTEEPAWSPWPSLPLGSTLLETPFLLIAWPQAPEWKVDLSE